jgi:hypothetical protein
VIDMQMCLTEASYIYGTYIFKEGERLGKYIFTMKCYWIVSAVMKARRVGKLVERTYLRSVGKASPRKNY